MVEISNFPWSYISFGILTLTTIASQFKSDIFKGKRKIILGCLILVAFIAQYKSESINNAKDQVIQELSLDTNQNVNDLKGELQEVKNELAGFQSYLNDFKYEIDPALENIKTSIFQSQEIAAQSIEEQNFVKRKTTQIHNSFLEFEEQMKLYQTEFDSISKKQLAIETKKNTSEISIYEPIFHIDSIGYHPNLKLSLKSGLSIDSINYNAVVVFGNKNGILDDKYFFKTTDSDFNTEKLNLNEVRYVNFTVIENEFVESMNMAFIIFQCSYFDQMKSKIVYSDLTIHQLNGLKGNTNQFGKNVSKENAESIIRFMKRKKIYSKFKS